MADSERKTDAGIDGEIELRNTVTGEVANRLILIQSKASDRRFPGENDRSFHFLCKQADVAYWMSADVPVLLVWGDRDRLVFSAGARRVLLTLPGSSLELIEDCGHCPQIEATDRLVGLLGRFAGPRSPGRLRVCSSHGT